MNFRLNQIQLASFLSSIDQSSLIKIASLAINNIAGISNVDPLIIPAPEDAPAQLPRIIIQNETTGWMFQYSHLRYDIFYSPQQLHYKDFEQAQTVIFQSSRKVFEAFTSDLAVRSNRLGLVANFVVEVDDAAEVIKNKYVKLGIKTHFEETQLHYRVGQQLDNLNVNQWVRLIGRKRPEKNEIEEIFMQIDVNTIPEKPIEVNVNSLKHFLDNAGQLILQSANFHAEI